MRSERASTVRMREDGQTCCFCGSTIDPPYSGREQPCSRCVAARSTYRLHMRFERCQGWRVSFRDLNNNLTNFREFTFGDPSKIEELVGRTATKMMSEDRQAFEHGIRNGLGAVNLILTKEQYRRLLR